MSGTKLLSLVLGAVLVLGSGTGICAEAGAKAGSEAGSSPASQPSAKKAAPRGSVYADQPEFTEQELMRFATLLPDFRKWCHAQGEKAHPAVRKGKADFVYSEAAAGWARSHGWDDRRFFCVMGRSAAALATIMAEEDKKKPAHYKDMPKVSQKELDLVRLHLGELLKAGSEESK